MSSIGLYQVIAKVYDILDVTYFRNRENSPRTAVLSRIQGNERILDLCTGTATNAINIASRRPGTEITGIDLSDKMLEVGRSKIRKTGISNVALERMDATDLSYGAGMFDVVLISLVLHELEDDLAGKLIREAKRVLKDDGRIIVTEWERPRKASQRVLFAPVAMLEPKPYRTFIRTDMYRYFEDRGLKVDEYIHCNYSRVLVLKKEEQNEEPSDARYLEQTKMLDYGDESIGQLVRERGWRKLPVYDRIGAVYSFVKDEILFGYNLDDDLPASFVLKDGYGQCNTKGTLFMALLRACDIPCRVHAFTIDKKLQHGAMTGFVYRNAPKNIFHSWVEVLYEGRWVNLEGLILDDKYLASLQNKFASCTGAFCEYGVGVEDFRDPKVEWDGEDTYIQKTGINQDFGVYNNPDDMLLEHHQQIGVVKRFIYRHLGRHLMNRNIRKVRERG